MSKAAVEIFLAAQERSELEGPAPRHGTRPGATGPDSAAGQ